MRAQRECNVVEEIMRCAVRHDVSAVALFYMKDFPIVVNFI